MSTYQPNFANPRVRKRIIKALGFIEKYVRSNPVPVSQSQIYEYLGRTDTDIGHYLKKQLLICVDPYYNMVSHVCKKYVRNQEGYEYLKNILGNEIKPIEIQDDLQEQLDTGEFEYKDLSQRLYNPLQYIPRKQKQDILTRNHYRHNYDIECAAPTLLYQYAHKLGLNKNLTYLENYIKNRSHIRNELSIRYNVSEKDIKQIINALIQGAYLSHSSMSKIYHVLRGNHRTITNLKDDVFLTGLREDISEMWRIISPVMKKELDKKRLTGRDKSAKYRELEREVMDVIKRELKRNKIKALLQHDGWTSREAVDIDYLRGIIKSQTGYVINFTWEVWE